MLSSSSEGAKTRGESDVATDTRNCSSTGGSDEKLRVVRELGADHVVNYVTCPAFGSVVKGLTGGRGADLIFDPVGGDELLLLEEAQLRRRQIRKLRTELREHLTDAEQGTLAGLASRGGGGP